MEDGRNKQRASPRAESIINLFSLFTLAGNGRVSSWLAGGAWRRRCRARQTSGWCAYLMACAAGSSANKTGKTAKMA